MNPEIHTQIIIRLNPKKRVKSNMAAEKKVGPAKGPARQASLPLAVDAALGMFDDPVKQALYFHLKKRGVDLKRQDTDLESIEAALKEIMGAGAEVISMSIRKEMERISAPA